jgi:hypothetical protein
MPPAILHLLKQMGILQIRSLQKQADTLKAMDGMSDTELQLELFGRQPPVAISPWQHHNAPADNPQATPWSSCPCNSGRPVIPMHSGRQAAALTCLPPIR